jgi:hypothetical protein
LLGDGRNAGRGSPCLSWCSVATSSTRYNCVALPVPAAATLHLIHDRGYVAYLVLLLRVRWDWVPW